LVCSQPTGRWTAKEPIVFEGGTTNLYEHCYHDPINYIDVDGQNPVRAAGAAAVAGARKAWDWARRNLDFDGPAKRLFDHGHGRIFQVRYKKDKVKVRLDYDPL
jgi:hypothetical protein